MNDTTFDISVNSQQPWEVLTTAPGSGSGAGKLVLPFSTDTVRPVLLASLAGGDYALALGAGTQHFANDLAVAPAALAMLRQARRPRRLPSNPFGVAGPNLTPGQTNYFKDLVTTPAGKACIADIVDNVFKGLSLVPGVGCVGDAVLGQVSLQLTSAITGDAYSLTSGTGPGANPVVSGAISALGCVPGGVVLKAIIEAGQDAVALAQTAADCSKTFLPKSGKGLPVGVRGPGDPNFKAGPAGAGAQQYIPPSQMLNYSVNFANEPTAGASAQNVTATDTIDPTKVDLTTFAFGPVVIGNHYFTPQPNATSIDTQIDLRPDVPIIAKVSASLNPSTGLVTWQFGSLDPSTGDPISPSSLSGFLPPDTAMPNGEVAVAFSANLLQGIATGATVNNTASIVFDGQPAMATNTWTNTIDASAPHSSVTALPANTPATAVNVSWSGTDAGSGIASYSIFVSDNGGPYTAWLTNTTSTSGVFTGKTGHLYAFFSLAVDAAGNIEPARTAADTSTTLSLAASSTTLMPVSGPVAANAPVTLTATVAGNPSLAGAPSGTVVFYGSSGSLGTATVNGGIATYTASGFPASQSITANYSGDANYASSASPAVMLNVVTLPAPTVNFTLPNQIFGVPPIALSATSNSPGAISYTVLSGPASISGSTLTVTGVGVVTVQANQSATSAFASGMQLTSFAVAQATPVIAWKPSTKFVNSGLPIGAGVLDATSTTPGSFLYAATTAMPGPIEVSTSSVLPPGSYTLTATFTPTDTADYATAVATTAFTVAIQHVWIINSTGSVSSLDDGGNVLNATPSAGGGIGIAIDNTGNIWSIHTGGSNLSEFNNLGVYTHGFSAGGLNAAKALAIDGNGSVWVANGNGSLSEFTNAGAPLTPSAGFTGGNLNAPTGVAIDISGNVWIANSGNNSVTKILGGAAPVAPLASGVTTSTLGAKP